MSWDLVLLLSPVFIVIVGGLLLMMVEGFTKPSTDPAKADEGEGTRAGLAGGTALVLAVGAVFSVAVWMNHPESFSVPELAPQLVWDRFSLFFAFVICGAGSLTALIAGGYLPEHRLDRGEFYPLLTFSAVGAMMLAASGDLLSLFVSLETMSLGIYCMTGFRRGSARSTEAAVKYFLLGSFAAALLVYGGALVYGMTGHTDFAGISDGIAALTKDPTATGKLGVVIAGFVLMLVGLAFKVSAVPFHMWTPDAYEGAPTPATSFMAAAVKAAAFAVMLRVLVRAFGDSALTSWASGWPPVVAVIAIITMTYANFVAGRQESVKRMLAYSSVAHAGYILVGVAAIVRSNADAQGSVLLYLFTYAFSTVGAFGALAWMGSRDREAVSYEDLSGLGKRHPAAAGAMTLFLLSLAGVPPTAGFFGKLFIVKAAIGAELYVLAVILLLNSVLAAYYYLRVLVYMYMREPAAGATVAIPMKSGYVALALVIAGLVVVGVGIMPSESLQAALTAVLS